MDLVLPVRWLNLIDFLVLTLALYGVLRWARQARAMRVVFWIVGMYVASLVTRRFDLIITSWVLDAASIGLIVMLLVMFQPELRRAFLRLDRVLRVSPKASSSPDPTVSAIAEAAFSMARDRTGALIVVVCDDTISELVEDGVAVGAEVSRPLLEAIFQKTAPTHDGAVLIDSGRISRVNVILPLSHRNDVPPEFGTRHRAAMGLAERSDAAVVVASEERGEVSLMRGSTWQVVPSAAELVMLSAASARGCGGSLDGARLAQAFTHNLHIKLGAAGLGILISALSLFSGGNTIRTVTVGVELVNLPRGFDVTDYTRTLEVSLRGRSWFMDTTNPENLVARFDMHEAHEGAMKLQPNRSGLWGCRPASVWMASSRRC
jgi:diadenylate cyclase